MKLPALAIATAFAIGIACGLNPEIAHRSRSHAFIAFLLCSAVTSLLIGIVFAVRSRVVIAGLGSLLCWGMLGMAGVCVEEQPRRADHILSLVDAGKINLNSPLRYYRRLADEPEKLPWGASTTSSFLASTMKECLCQAAPWLCRADGSWGTNDAARRRLRRGFDTGEIAPGIQGRRSVRSP